MPDDLEQRLAEAVQAVASTPLGEATQTFLDVEELFFGFLFSKYNIHFFYCTACLRSESEAATDHFVILVLPAPLICSRWAVMDSTGRICVLSILGSRFDERKELVASVGGEAPFEANESEAALMKLRQASGFGMVSVLLFSDVCGTWNLGSYSAYSIWV